MGESDAVKALSIGLLSFTAVGACVVRMVWTCRRVREANEREGGSRAHRQREELARQRAQRPTRGRNARRNRRRGSRDAETEDGAGGDAGGTGGGTGAGGTAADDADFALALQMESSSSEADDDEGGADEDDIPMALVVPQRELHGAAQQRAPATGGTFAVLPATTAQAIEMARQQRERRSALDLVATTKTTHNF